MKCRRILRSVAAVIGFGLWTWPALAEGVLRLAGPIFPPYYESDGESISGPLADILKIMAETAHYRWAGDLFPAPRLMESLIRGEVDCSLLVRNKLLDDSPAMLRSDRMISEMVLNLYAADEVLGQISRDDLRHRTIIVMRGYGYGGLRAWMDDKANDITLVESNSHASAVAMLAAKRAPFALLYDVNFEDGLKALTPPPTHIIVNSFQRVPLYLYVGRNAQSNGQAVMDRMMAAYDILLQNHVLSQPKSRPEETIRKGS